MAARARSLWLNLSQSLGFVPGVIVVLFGTLGIVLVEIDGQLDDGEAAGEEPASKLLTAWRSQPPGLVLPPRPGLRAAGPRRPAR